MIRSLFKRSSLQFFGMITGKLISTVVFIIAARQLQPTNYGKLTFFITLISLTTVFADFGLNQYYQKQSNFLNHNQLLFKVLNARVMSLLISLLIVSIVLLTTKSFSFLISLATLAIIVVEASLSIFDGYFLVRKQAVRIAIKYVLKVTILALIYFIFNAFVSLELLVVAWAVASFISMLWFTPWSVVKNWQVELVDSLRTLKQSSRYALLIITSYAYARGDAIVIEYSAGSRAQGLYGIAYRYLEGFSLLPSALSQNLFHIAGKKEGITLKQVIKIVSLMLAIGSLVGFFLFFFAEFLTVTLLGSAYAPSSSILQIFSVVLVLFFINSPLSTVVQSSNILDKFLPWGIANTILNIALNIILIPLYGFQVAAWVMLTTEVTGLLINLRFIYKIYKK